ncbi:hypothetical protein [Microseira wollei]|nr:hypothetical protein [Microseira wollei]
MPVCEGREALPCTQGSGWMGGAIAHQPYFSLPAATRRKRDKQEGRQGKT